MQLMKLYRRRMIVLFALGLTPPRAELRLVGGGKFEPYLKIDEELRSYHTETKKLLGSILTRNGALVLNARLIDSEGAEYEDIHFGTTHMIGSCRMAESRKDGVVDPRGEMFGYPGLFISDGAAVPSSLAVSSSLTILANSERIASMTRTYGRSSATSGLELPQLSSQVRK